MSSENIILETEHLKTYFPVEKGLFRSKKCVKAVDDVSLTLYHGETYGLVGETGCGKSTLGRTLIRLLDPTEGSIRFEGTDISGLSEKNIRKYRPRMQMIFQDPYTSLDPRQRVGDILKEVLTIHKIGTPESREEAVFSMMKKVGLQPEYYYRYPHEFSGGQRQRIGIARALLSDPDLIICDEPVSALDVSIQSQIINLLKDLNEDGKRTYLFIAHDLSVVHYISDRIGVMYLGHIVEESESKDLFSNPLHPYTQALLSAVPSISGKRKERIHLKGTLPSPIDPPAGCPFCTRCRYATEECRTTRPKLNDMNGHKVACHRFNRKEKEECMMF